MEMLCFVMNNKFYAAKQMGSPLDRNDYRLLSHILLVRIMFLK